MKKKKELIKGIAKLALKTAKKEADSACLFMGYQPKMPKKVKELKKY